MNPHWTPWYLRPVQPQINLPHSIDRMRPLPSKK